MRLILEILRYIDYDVVIVPAYTERCLLMC